MARRTIFDEVTRNAGRFGKRTSKALRKGMKLRKRKGGKRNKRNSRDIHALSEQVTLLTQQISLLTARDAKRDS
jgi:hypothetical protein